MSQFPNLQGDVVFAGNLFSVRRQPVRHADGSESLYDIVDHPDAAAIVAIRKGWGPDQPLLVALVRQSRPAIGKETLELPAGIVRSDEIGLPEQTAARELMEETGWRAGSWQLLVRQYPSAGFSNEAIWIYLANDLEEMQGAVPDPHEILGLEWMPIIQALAYCRDGTIDDGKTITGLYLAADALALHRVHWDKEDGGELWIDSSGS
ncbi:MAG: NUDIX hydrolase [Ktedonobacterales bacterium]